MKVFKDQILMNNITDIQEINPKPLLNNLEILNLDNRYLTNKFMKNNKIIKNNNNKPQKK